MTKLQLEMLAIAMYESYARHVDGRDGRACFPWISLPKGTRDAWRREADKAHASGFTY